MCYKQSFHTESTTCVPYLLYRVCGRLTEDYVQMLTSFHPMAVNFMRRYDPKQP